MRSQSWCISDICMPEVTSSYRLHNSVAFRLRNDFEIHTRTTACAARWITWRLRSNYKVRRTQMWSELSCWVSVVSYDLVPWDFSAVDSSTGIFPAVPKSSPTKKNHRQTLSSLCLHWNQCHDTYKLDGWRSVRVYHPVTLTLLNNLACLPCLSQLCLMPRQSPFFFPPTQRLN